MHIQQIDIGPGSDYSADAEAGNSKTASLPVSFLYTVVKVSSLCSTLDLSLGSSKIFWIFAPPGLAIVRVVQTVGRADKAVGAFTLVEVSVAMTTGKTIVADCRRMEKSAPGFRGAFEHHLAVCRPADE